MTTHSPAGRSCATSSGARSPDSTCATPTPSCSAPRRNVGRARADDCPVCGTERMRYVSYVYGDKLKQANGRCITYRASSTKLDASYDEFACYVVEVCVDCRWNHLDRRYLHGRCHAG